MPGCYMTEEEHREAYADAAGCCLGAGCVIMLCAAIIVGVVWFLMTVPIR